MTSIIEKRRSLHRHVENQRQQNKILKMQLGQVQALANIGTTTCMIAHEINNLLTPLSGYAALALSSLDDKATIVISSMDVVVEGMEVRVQGEKKTGEKKGI